MNQEQIWHDQRTRYFADYCERHKDEYCPRAIENNHGKKERVTWAQLFEKRCGKSLEVYRHEKPNANPAP